MRHRRLNSMLIVRSAGDGIKAPVATVAAPVSSLPKSVNPPARVKPDV
jgi:hypothetical protein